MNILILIQFHPSEGPPETAETHLWHQAGATVKRRVAFRATSHKAILKGVAKSASAAKSATARLVAGGEQ